MLGTLMISWHMLAAWTVFSSGVPWEWWCGRDINSSAAEWRWGSTSGFIKTSNWFSERLVSMSLLNQHFFLLILDVSFYDCFMMCFSSSVSRIQQTPGTQNLDAILTQQLKEKLRAAKVTKWAFPRFSKELRWYFSPDSVCLVTMSNWQSWWKVMMYTLHVCIV